MDIIWNDDGNMGKSCTMGIVAKIWHTKKWKNINKK